MQMITIEPSRKATKTTRVPAIAAKVDIQSSITRDNLELQIFRNRSEMEANLILKDTGEVIDRIPVSWKSRGNQLDYLSVSKIEAYQQCPACFFKQYMEAGSEQVDNGNFYTKFGSILHTVVERAYTYYVQSGIVVDPMSIFDYAWSEYDLVDFDAYTEAKSLLREYFGRNPVNQRMDDPICIEYEWRGQLAGCTFGMMIDYAGIFRHNKKWGVLRDYKTNRVPYTPAQLESSFQLRTYEVVLRKFIAPEIERWTAGYEMFRFGWQECPEFTDEDLTDAEHYIADTWKQISNDTVWEAKLNNFCGFRDCRFTCKKYKQFLDNPERYCEGIQLDSTNLEDIYRQRRLMDTYEKVAKKRKEECDGILKSAIDRQARAGKKLVLAGKELQLYAQPKGSYRYYDTRNVLLTQNKLHLLDECLSISKTKMDSLVAGDPSLKLALAGCQTTNYASPYIVEAKAK